MLKSFLIFFPTLDLLLCVSGSLSCQDVVKLHQAFGASNRLKVRQYLGSILLNHKSAPTRTSLWHSNPKTKAPCSVAIATRNGLDVSTKPEALAAYRADLIPDHGVYSRDINVHARLAPPKQKRLGVAEGALGAHAHVHVVPLLLQIRFKTLASSPQPGRFCIRR